MKRKLRQIVSILCLLALAFGCTLHVSMAEDGDVTRVITAEWADENNYDGLRPGELQVKLGDATAVLNSANNWTAAVTAPADAEWTIPEEEGYHRTVYGTDTVRVVYVHTVTKAPVTASVVWNDSDNAGGIRPDSVRLRLLADGKPCGSERTASAGNGWKATWGELPVNREGSKEAIVYTIGEAVPDGYVVSFSGLTATNTLQTGALSLQAAVSGYPEGADVSGLTLRVTGPDPKMPVTLTYGALSGGAYDFGQVLPGAYVVQETNADTLAEGYEMDPAASRIGDAVLVKAGESAALSFRYVYREPVAAEPNEDPLSEAGKLTFEINGPDPRMPMTVTFSEFSDGKYELDGLVPGTYYVVERNAENLVTAYTLTSDSVTGAISIVAGGGSSTVTLFNRYTPAPTPEPEAELISIPVTKTWNDDGNRDGNRPASITVRLYADGTLADTRTATEAGGWLCTFEDLPRYHADGTEIVYTVDEEPVEWYTSVVTGYNITNNYTPEVTSVTVTKAWDDDNNAQRFRPTTLAVTLLPVNRVYVLSEANNWTVTVDNLPTRINGEPVVYSWTEQEAVGYIRSGMEQSGNATIFTNRIVRVPEIPEGRKKPRVPGGSWAYFEEYETALGIDSTINHVGDCFD